MSHLVAPSVLAADFGKLNSEIEMVNHSEADWIHIDVMDGQFVPNISFGFPIIKAIKKAATKPLDVHLMIVEPEKYIEQFASSGADVITVHYEACNHIHRTLAQIKEVGCKAGVALNPHTPVSVLEDVLGDMDVVCLMSVNPGFGGQSFIERTYEKIRKLRMLSPKASSNFKIEIDGGVGLKNYEKLIKTGADVLVAGSAIFKAENPTNVITQLKSLSNNTITV